MTSLVYFRPAIPLLISLIGGILLGSELSGFEIGAAAAAAVFAAFGLLRIYRRQTALVSPILLFFALGYISIAPWVHPRFPANHLIHYAGSDRWDIAGNIAGRPQQINNRTRLILRITSLGDGRQKHAVSGKLRVTVAGELPGIAVGDHVRFSGRLRSITNFKNPGAFDYRRYMAFKGIWVTAYVTGDRLAVIGRHRACSLLQFINKARNTYSDLIDKSGHTEAQAVFKALIIGDRTQISRQTRQSFNRAGLGHLLAISGLHIGIVAMVAFVLFQALMVRIKLFLWQAWTRKSAALLSLLPVLIYGAIAGFSPSTQRAVIMVAVFLLTFLFEKEQDPLNTLALAALLILMVDPPSLYSISFQLSFTAVCAIIYGLSRLRNRNAVHKTRFKTSWFFRFKGKLTSFFLVSFFAVCGSLPLVTYYFNQISLVGLAANFIAVPLIGFVTIPLGMAALFILPISLTLAFWFIKAAAVVLAFTLGVVHFFADLPFAALKTVTPSLLEIGCFYIMGWALLNLRRSGPRVVHGPPCAAAGQIAAVSGVDGPPTVPSGRRRFHNFLGRVSLSGLSTPTIAKSVLVLILFTLALDTCYWLYQRFWHPDLRVTVIDVGHGSASLLELPGGHIILIDGGGFADNSTFNIGERVIAPFLWRKKIKTVDTLILSHPNSDHLNGLVYIADYFTVKNIWTNNEPGNTVGYKKFMEVIMSKNIPRPVFEKMARNYRIKNVELNLLYPPPNFMTKRRIDKWRNMNNNSLVVKASMGSTSFLFPGDIQAEAEKELVKLVGSRLSSTVLIAPHHGSRTSNSEIFISKVNPEKVIFSSGRSSRFKLPNSEVLKRYGDRDCSIWRTDVNGAVMLSTDGQGLEVKAFDG
jgi:competence protein ComEC